MFTITELVRHFLLIAVISFILAVIAVNFFARFVRPAMRIRMQLRMAVERLGQIKAASKDPIKDLGENSRTVFSSPQLMHGWQEYRETLHEQNIGDPYGNGKSVRWRSTTLAETFFTQQALVDTPLKTDFYKHLPGILTGLGIIGTFSGLVTGLIRFEVSGNAERVRSSLNSLIQSVGYSFVVSAMAITLAMVFIWLEKSLVAVCYRHVENLCQLMDSLFETGVGEEYLARLVESSEASAQQVLKIKDSLVGDLSQVLTVILTQQMKASAMLNKQLLAGVAQDIGDNIREPMEKLAAAVGVMKADPAESAGEALRDTLKSFAEQMQEIFDSQVREMANLLKETGRTMESASLQMTRSIITAHNTGRGNEEAMAERMVRTMKSLDERQKIMDNSLSEFVSQASLVSGSQTVAAKSLQSIMTDISVRMADMMERLEAGSQHAAQEFEAKQARLTDQTVSITGAVNDQLKALAAEMHRAGLATRESTQCLALVVKESSNLITAGRDALKGSLDEFARASGTLNATLMSMQKATEGIQGSSWNLVQATSGVKDMLDTHKRTSDVFARIVTELRSTIDNARHEASMTSDIVAGIQKATEQLGLAQNKAEEYLHGLTEVLAQAHCEFAGNIELTLKKSNTQFHEELSRAVSLVSGAIQDFGDVLDSASLKDKKQCWV